jgi:hypothetical protein
MNSLERLWNIGTYRGIDIPFGRLRVRGAGGRIDREDESWRQAHCG